MIKTEKNSLDKKNAIWNTLGSTLYAFTSLIFLIIVVRINGEDQAGIFTFGFSFACMMYVLGTYSGRTFQVTEQNKKITQGSYLLFKIFTCTSMIVIAFCFCIIRQYDTEKIFIIVLLILYKAIDAYSDSIYAVFQRNNHLYKSGISLTLRSFICVIAFFIVDLAISNMLVSIIAMIIVNILIFIFYDLRTLSKYKVSIQQTNKKILITLLVTGLSTFCFFFLSQLLINSQKYIIDAILDNNSQAIFGIIIMPATFISVASLLIINPFVYKMKIYVSEKNYVGLKHLAYKICLYVLLIGIITIIVAFVLGIPVLELLYSIELKEYLWDLEIIISGSLFLGLVAVLSNCLITIRHNNIQLLLYIISVIFSFVTSIFLIQDYGIRGACISFMSSSILLFILYIVVFQVKYNKLIKDKN